MDSLSDVLHWRSQHQPNQKAYTFLIDGEADAIHITYSELDQQARAIAAQLQATVDCGDRALLLYPQGLDFIAAFFGCLYAGVIAVPAALPRRSQKTTRLEAITANSQAKVALTNSSVQPLINKQIPTDSPLSKLAWIATDTVASIPTAARTSLIETWQTPNSQPLAFIQYTSGSTGSPKGVIVSHDNLSHNSKYIQTAFALSPKSVSVTWLPSFHDMGLIDGIIQPLYTGFLGVLMSPGSFIQKPIRWLQAISDYQATHCGGPNLGYELCTQKIAPEAMAQLDLSRWESAYSGSEPVRQPTLDAFAAKFACCGFSPNAFYPCYGMAEATLMVTGGRVDEPPVFIEVSADELARHRIVEADGLSKSATRVLVGCGRSHLNTRVAIVDPQQKTRCKPDQVGEIWVAGPGISQGYWQQPERTEETFGAYLASHEADVPPQGPFLRTGDLGFLRSSELFVTGRIKDAIIIWGRNHYPQDIELTVTQSHEALRPECGAAFSVEVEGAERLVIVQEIERTHLRNFDCDQIASAIRQAVAEQHDIQVYAIALIKTASLLKTSSGKVQRQACKTAFTTGALQTVGEWVGTTAPIDELPTILPVESQASIKSATDAPAVKNSERLEITEFVIQDWLIDKVAESTQQNPDDIDIEVSFSEYALDSSVSMSLTGELADWLGCHLEPTLFWEYPNIEVLSQYLFNRATSAQ